MNTFPRNVYVEIGSVDGTREWNFSGEFNQTNNITTNFASSINSNITGCVRNAENCSISFLFHSDTSGILQYLDININWTETIRPNNTINSITTTPENLTITVNTTANDDFLNTCFYGIYDENNNLIIANTTYTCNTLITPSVGNFITYTFYSYVNDTSNNLNQTTRTFTVSHAGGSGSGVSQPPPPEQTIVPTPIPEFLELQATTETTTQPTIIESIPVGETTVVTPDGEVVIINRTEDETKVGDIVTIMESETSLIDNEPTNILFGGAVIVNSGGGGGITIGIPGTNPIVISKPPIIWGLQTQFRGSSYELEMSRLFEEGRMSERELRFKNDGTETTNIKLECIGVTGTDNICKYVTFKDNELEIPPLKGFFTITTFSVNIPENIDKGSYIFNVRAIDPDNDIAILSSRVNVDVGGLGGILAYFRSLGNSKNIGVFDIPVFGTLFIIFGGIIIGILIHLISGFKLHWILSGIIGWFVSAVALIFFI